LHVDVLAELLSGVLRPGEKQVAVLSKSDIYAEPFLKGLPNVLAGKR